MLTSRSPSNFKLGVEAWKQERLWKKRVKALLRAGNLVPPEDLDPIPDPEAGSKPEPEAGSVLSFDSEPEAGSVLGFNSEPDFDSEPGFELELEPGFELESDPRSQLALQLQRELENTGELGEE
ncbi:hypothetical protein V498_01326 [Pseudogymnoascus sp. VKM F-4517 (FW-2822)]|nr:hypothetical protein V498_01326 [Pseudogymnoascus sp. VKM F-4517 (FW-2822)]